MTLEELNDLVIDALEDLKATDIQSLDVRGITSIADIMIIANGNSSRQVRALSEKVVQSVKENGVMPLGTEGMLEGDWALIDLGDIIVHIMRPPVREYYQLEKLWSTEPRQSSAT